MGFSLRIVRVLICFILALAFVTSLQAQTNYYWNGGLVTSVTSWGLNLDGSGANPTNFTTASQIFNIQTAQTPSTAAIWTISGAGSGLLVQTGGSFSSTVNNSLNLSLQTGATYVQTGSYTSLSFGTIDPGSTFNLTTANFRNLAYGGFKWTGSAGALTIAANQTFTGNLQQSGSSVLGIAANANFTVAVNRDLIVDATRTFNMVSGTATNAILNLGGNYINSGTATSTGSGTGNFNFTGSGTNNATFGTFGTVTGTINYSVASTKTIIFQDTLTTTSKVTLTNAGTVQLGTGGTAGGLTGNMTNNGILIINRSDPYSLGGNISGSGSLQQIGSGTTTLGGTNTYAGTTTVTNGFIAINDEARLGNAPGSFTANQLTLNGGGLQAVTSSVNFASSNNRGITIGASGGTFDTNGQGISIETPIAGSAGGSLTKIGAAALSLNAASTYNGNTNIRDGLLSLYSLSGDSTNRLPSTTVLTLGTATTSGTVQLGRDGINPTNPAHQTLAGLATTIGGTTSTNTITSDTTTNANLTINNSANYTFAGTIGGTNTVRENNINVIKQGNGIQTFSGPNTYTGTTLVSAGILLVNGTHTGGGQYTVDTGGTLGGTGTINAPVNVVTGTLAPGTSPGRLTINGNVAFTNTTSSVFSVEINGGTTAGTDYDQLRVGSGGSLTLNGATLTASLGFDPAGTEKIFLTDNLFVSPISGTFNNLPEGSNITLISPSSTVYTGVISYLGDFTSLNTFGGNDVVIYNLTSAIPEPGTIALLGLTGFFGLQWYLRRKPAVAKKEGEKSEGETTTEPAPVEVVA